MKQAEELPLFVRATFSFYCLPALLLQVVNADDQVAYLQSYCSQYGHYDPGSSYENNLNQVLYNLNSESSTKKFYNLSIGEAPNKVYGLFLCNGAYTTQVCQLCITVAAGEVLRSCPSSVEAIVWYIECMLWYSNHSTVSTSDSSIFYNLEGGRRGYSQYNKQLIDTIITLSNQTTTGNSSLVYATTLVYVEKHTAMTCYVDCIPYLSPSDCHKCLQTVLGRLPIDGSQSGVLLQPSCRLMYDFSDGKLLSPAGNILYIALGILSVVAAASLLLHLFNSLRRRKSHRNPKGLDDIGSMQNLHFEFDAMSLAVPDNNWYMESGRRLIDTSSYNLY